MNTLNGKLLWDSENREKYPGLYSWVMEPDEDPDVVRNVVLQDESWRPFPQERCWAMMRRTYPDGGHGSGGEMAATYEEALVKLERSVHRRFEQDRMFNAQSQYDFFQRLTAWSDRTFGLGDRTTSVVDHIKKELKEIEADPTNLEEWVDVIILAMDGARRAAGATSESLVKALWVKHEVNEQRKWPPIEEQDRTKSIEHVRDDND